jgi:curved DNA-binding protein CbpA
MNPYIALGVPPDATLDTIKRAWRRLSRKHHSDRKGGSHEAQQQLNDAYKILSDPERRERWDLTGEDKPKEPIDVTARSVILQMISQVLNNPMDIDIHMAVTKLIAQNCVTARDKVNQLKGRLSALKRQRGRTRVKDSGRFILDLFDQVEAGLREAMSKCEGEIAILTRAAEMFREACDPSEPVKDALGRTMDPVAQFMFMNSNQA